MLTVRRGELVDLLIAVACVHALTAMQHHTALSGGLVSTSPGKDHLARIRLRLPSRPALRRKAKAEHRSMQQVAQAAIDAYVHQPTPLRRQAVPVADLAALFGDLPPVNAADFRAEQDRYADADAHFDAYSRADDSGEGQ